MTPPVEPTGTARRPLRGNDWRQVELPPPREFRPELPVSVIVPYFSQREELGRTLAALAGQTWPRELFEVVVVDDGSPTPLTEVGARLIEETPFEVRPVRQEDRGFGRSQARNAGARAAAHDILLFLDADLLPEADWIRAHARWHHAVSDALTLGGWAHVSVDGVDAGAIRSRPGSLKELFADRPADFVDETWRRGLLRESDGLTVTDGPFRILGSGNFGIRRRFFDLVGGFDESFTGWGGEDVEFGYRAFTRGGLFVPVLDAFAWHQGPWEAGRAAKERREGPYRARLAHLIPHCSVRYPAPGRARTVPEFVVTIPGEAVPAMRLLRAVGRLLAAPTHDLVVRLELPNDHEGRERLDLELGPDPRVRVAPPCPALEEFPVSPFQVTLPARGGLGPDVVGRLRTALGTAVLARCVFPDGSRAEIVRTWALHRALRTPWEASDFGEVVTIPPAALLPAPAAAPPPPPLPADGRLRRLSRRFVTELGRVTGPRQAWRFVRWFGGAVLRRVSSRFVPPASPPALVPLEALGPRSRALFPAEVTAGLTVADTAAEAAGADGPVVVLEESSPLLSVPALVPATHNPVAWRYHYQRTVGALGPLDRLPPGVPADCVVDEADSERIASLHHLVDVEAFHPDPRTRAAALVRLAARGTLVQLADAAPHLEGLLGAELHGLLSGTPPESDASAREALSIRIRRAALRGHSPAARTRQLSQSAGVEGPSLPLVSVLLVTKRPALLEHALAGVARQTWPRLELVLGLHGGGFAGVEERLAELSLPATVVRIEAEAPLGAALNRVAPAATGELLTKLDDDDAYGSEHLWDLVLAHEYSAADLVTKTAEFVYLAASGVTIRHHRGESEVRGAMGAGGTILMPHEALRRVGGFPEVAGAVDRRLFERVRERGGTSYRTHGAGFVLVCHPRAHTWNSDAWFLDRTVRRWPGWDPEGARIGDMDASWLPAPLSDPVGGR